MNECGCVPIKLRKQAAGGMWSMEYSLVTSDLDYWEMEKQSNILLESLHFEISLLQLSLKQCTLSPSKILLQSPPLPGSHSDVRHQLVLLLVLQITLAHTGFPSSPGEEAFQTQILIKLQIRRKVLASPGRLAATTCWLPPTEPWCQVFSAPIPTHTGHHTAKGILLAFQTEESELTSGIKKGHFGEGAQLIPLGSVQIAHGLSGPWSYLLREPRENICINSWKKITIVSISTSQKIKKKQSSRKPFKWKSMLTSLGN